jgi:DNA polymerase-3 subunit epsilon
MLLSRRVYPEAPNHQLGTLVSFTGIPVLGRFHRAMADASMAAHLVLRMKQRLRDRYLLEDVPHEMLRMVQRAPVKLLDRRMESFLKSRARG